MTTDRYQGVSTPWGLSQGGEKLADGVTSYHTAGHGGIRVAPALNRRIPAEFRRSDGWYEEDANWAIPCVFLGVLPDHRASAEKTLATYYEGAWGAWQERGAPMVEPEPAPEPVRPTRRVFTGKPEVKKYLLDNGVDFPFAITKRTSPYTMQAEYRVKPSAKPGEPRHRVLKAKLNVGTSAVEYSSEGDDNLMGSRYALLDRLLERSNARLG